MTDVLRAFLIYAKTSYARFLMLGLLVVLASKLSVTPVGLAVFAAAAMLAFTNGRMAIMFLFGSTFLPYVFGVPVTQAYAAVILLLPMVLLDLSRASKLVPRSFALLLLIVAALIAATYPFHKSIDVQVLGFSLCGALVACYLVRRDSIPVTEILGDLAWVVGATLFVPLLSNSIAVPLSPFWVDRHLGYFAIDRFSVAFVEPNTVSAYLAATFLLILISYRHRSYLTLLTASAFSVLLLYGVNLAGSRTALAFAAIAITAVSFVSLALQYRGRTEFSVSWPSVRMLCLSVLMLIVAGTLSYSVALGEPPAGLSRLAGTSGFEETGRPKSFRDAAPLLDTVPIAGRNLQHYVLHEAAHTPHASPLAALLFLGLPVALGLFALVSVPIIDLLTGSKLSPTPHLAVAIGALFVIMLTLPITSDRGMLVLIGLWFGASRLPSYAFRGAQARSAPSLSP